MDKNQVLVPAFLSARRFCLLAGLVVSVVVCLGLAADSLIETEPGLTTEAVLWRFSLDSDSSVPTWFASILLGLAALLLGVSASLASSAADRQAWCWWLLSGIFWLLSLDEVAMLHELSGTILKRIVPALGDLRGVFYFTWTMVAIPLVLLLGLVLLRWFFDLPSRTRTLFGLSAFLFISGSVGVEMLNASVAANDVIAGGGRSGRYLVGNFIEEALEFSGVILFIYAQLKYLKSRGVSFVLAFRASSNRDSVKQMAQPIKCEGE